MANIISPDIRLSFFRTSDGAQEIDLIIERPGKPVVLLEIKSTDRIVGDEAVKKLKLFEGDFNGAELYILSRDRKERLVDGVRLLPWDVGIRALFKA